jgi:hypothetical protein
MPEFRFDTYCGLYCGACDIMRAYRDGLETGRPPEWKDLPERFTGHLPRAAGIKCHGCKSDIVFAGCQGCPIRACARKRGITGTCRDCAKYPCLIHMTFKLIWWIRKLDKKLPHWRAAAGNLKAMERDGIESWLSQQERIWQCPDCGQAFTWYGSACARCAREVESLKDYNNLKT